MKAFEFESSLELVMRPIEFKENNHDDSLENDIQKTVIGTNESHSHQSSQSYTQ